MLNTCLNHLGHLNPLLPYSVKLITKYQKSNLSMCAQTTYRIKLNLNGLEIEVEGDRDFVESKISDLSWIDAISKRLQGQIVKHSPRVISIDKKMSFTEFSTELNPQTHLQRILTIAYYLYRFEERDFTYDDIESFYEQRRWPRPANPRQAVSDLIEEGYIEKSGKTNGRKSFRILEKGIRYVETMFKEEEI